MSTVFIEVMVIIDYTKWVWPSHISRGRVCWACPQLHSFLPVCFDNVVGAHHSMLISTSMQEKKSIQPLTLIRASFSKEGVQGCFSPPPPPTLHNAERVGIVFSEVTMCKYS